MEDGGREMENVKWQREDGNGRWEMGNGRCGRNSPTFALLHFTSYISHVPSENSQYLCSMMSTNEEVVLVDSSDTETGTMEKLEAHRKGLLHRAFSVFVSDSKGRMLLQQRAAGKYHSPGLWTNTCCSHPRPHENTEKAARRRLKEEMGLDPELNYKTHFIYRAEFDNGLTEYEFDHIFTAVSDQEPQPDPNEVSAWKWLPVQEIKQLVLSDPNAFTPWFRIAIEKFF